MPGFEDLVTQLSGVRIGQNDKGRLANVSGTILKSILADQWIALAERERNALISESAPKLRREYEAYLRRGFRTKEAAKEVMRIEYDRLSEKYAPQSNL